MKALFIEKLAPIEAPVNSTIVQHIQTDHYSLVLRTLDAQTLMIEWQTVIDNYEVQTREIKALRKAIQNYVLKNGPIFLLVKTYSGISLNPSAQKKLQDKKIFGGIRGVAVVLQSTTARLSLNMVAKFNRSRIPVRGFTSQRNGYKWLLKKAYQLSKGN